MIEFLNDEIREFADMISDSTLPPVELYVVPGYDALEVNDSIHQGTLAFGAYEPDRKRIIVPEGITDEDKERALSTIAHEYYHHIEACKGLKHNEEKAEKFAANAMRVWMDWVMWR